jgi:hypothetical protein
MQFSPAHERLMHRMFPSRQAIRVYTRSGQDVFSDPDDNVLPGFQMNVLLEATSVRTDRTLGRAVCGVNSEAQVVSLRPTKSNALPQQL